MTIENFEEKSMEDLFNGAYDFKRIRRGDIIKGKIIKVTDKEAFVNINYISDGIIPKEELTDDLELDPRDILTEGQEIDVIVLSTDDGEGNVLVSKKQADAIKVWEGMEGNKELGTIIKVKVKEAVKGGAVAMIKGIRAFIPASQLSLNHVENIEDFVGKELEVKVIEVNENDNKIILSRKIIEKEQAQNAKDKIWSELSKGEKRSAVITRLAKFGAFADLGGLEGLIHLSDLSWKRVMDPAEIVSIGDKVEVYVIDFDKEKNRVSLGLKSVEEDPWNIASSTLKVNDIVEGVVTKLMNFGAFVEVSAGVEGLVHLSELSEERVIKASDIINVGDKVKVKILGIDVKNKKLSLSIKEAIEKPHIDYSEYNDSDNGLTLGDLLKDKLKGLKFEE